MRTDQAITFFGNKSALSRAIGYSRQAVYHWGEYPPLNAQLRIQLASDNLLMAEQPVGKPIIGAHFKTPTP